MAGRDFSPLSKPVCATSLSKPALRAQALARRSDASRDAAAAFAQQLAAEGLSLVMRLHPEAVSAYFPIGHEPSTLPLLHNLAAAGVRTALPVTGKLGTPLVFRLWRPGEPTAKGKMAIEEPLRGRAGCRAGSLVRPLGRIRPRGAQDWLWRRFLRPDLSEAPGQKADLRGWRCLCVPRVSGGCARGTRRTPRLCADGA